MRSTIAQNPANIRAPETPPLDDGAVIVMLELCPMLKLLVALKVPPPLLVNVMSRMLHHDNAMALFEAIVAVLPNVPDAKPNNAELDEPVTFIVVIDNVAAAPIET